MFCKCLYTLESFCGGDALIALQQYETDIREAITVIVRCGLQRSCGSPARVQITAWTPNR